MRILIVEDNVKLAESLKKGLQQEGYAVEVALDGAEGEKLIGSMEDGYDVVILDLMLPRIDGITLCRNMRAAGNRSPVLMLTARDGVKDRVGGLDAGADDYLTKPFSFEELAARIRALARRSRVPVEPVLQRGDVVLDPATHEVTRKGRRIALTAKEFGILELLMRHPRQIFSREQIMRSLWSQDSEESSNVVEVHIKNVRKKLSEEGNDGHIETVRGVGYRFVD